MVIIANLYRVTSGLVFRYHVTPSLLRTRYTVLKTAASILGVLGGRDPQILGRERGSWRGVVGSRGGVLGSWILLYLIMYTGSIFESGDV